MGIEDYATAGRLSRVVLEYALFFDVITTSSFNKLKKAENVVQQATKWFNLLNTLSVNIRRWKSSQAPEELRKAMKSEGFPVEEDPLSPPDIAKVEKFGDLLIEAVEEWEKHIEWKNKKKSEGRLE